MGAFDQADRLLLDLSADAGIPELDVTLEARTGTAMAALFSAQKPNDFNLLAKLPASDLPVVGAGYMDMKSMTPWFLDLMGGDAAQTKELTAVMNDLVAVATGEFAMAGEAGPQTESSYVMRVTDPKRAFALFPKLQELMAKVGVMGSQMSVKPRPGTKIGNVPVKMLEASYDFSKMPGYQGPPKVKTTIAYAGWDDVLGFIMGKDTTARMKTLIEASRAQPPRTLESSLLADLARARGTQDSIFMRMDLSKVSGAASPAPAGTSLIMRVGFTASSGKLRLLLGQMPASTGTRATSVNTPK
jgi:hypothetical protein